MGVRPVLHIPHGCTYYLYLFLNFFCIYLLTSKYKYAILISRWVMLIEKPWQEVERVIENGMSNAEFNAFLETLARLIESKATTIDEAAQLIREAKTQ